MTRSRSDRCRGLAGSHADSGGRALAACAPGCCLLAPRCPHGSPPLASPCSPLPRACSKERVDRIQELRWTHRTLPEHVKANLSPLEQQVLGGGKDGAPRDGVGWAGGHGRRAHAAPPHRQPSMLQVQTRLSLALPPRLAPVPQPAGTTRRAGNCRLLSLPSRLLLPCSTSGSTTSY